MTAHTGANQLIQDPEHLLWKTFIPDWSRVVGHIEPSGTLNGPLSRKNQNYVSANKKFYFQVTEFYSTTNSGSGRPCSKGQYIQTPLLKQYLAIKLGLFFIHSAWQLKKQQQMDDTCTYKNYVRPLL